VPVELFSSRQPLSSVCTLFGCADHPAGSSHGGAGNVFRLAGAFGFSRVSFYYLNSALFPAFVPGLVTDCYQGAARGATSSSLWRSRASPLTPFRRRARFVSVAVSSASLRKNVTMRRMLLDTVASAAAKYCAAKPRPDRFFGLPRSSALASFSKLLEASTLDLMP
jgi:hypothetical protein